ncbi:MAG: hypothetical protein H7Z75_02460 [Ferruginibacter sp.]|nr:hypothetical protein [Cytophagales bacterium]
MRIVAHIPHPQCKITVFAWNGKYIVKIETDTLEQTYKVSESDVAGEEALKKLLDDAFLEGVMKRFAEMDSALSEALGPF